MRWILIFTALLLTGCATGRTTIVVSGEVDQVEVQARYEIGPAAKAIR